MAPVTLLHPRAKEGLISVGFNYNLKIHSYEKDEIFEKRAPYDGPVKYRYMLYKMLSNEEQVFLKNIDGSIKVTYITDGMQWDIHTLLEFSRESDIMLFRLSHG